MFLIKDGSKVSVRNWSPSDRAFAPRLSSGHRIRGYHSRMSDGGWGRIRGYPRLVPRVSDSQRGDTGHLAGAGDIRAGASRPRPDKVTRERGRVKRGDIGIQIDWGNHYTRVQRNLFRKQSFLGSFDKHLQNIQWLGWHSRWIAPGNAAAEKIKWQGFVHKSRRPMSWGLMSSLSASWCLGWPAYYQVMSRRNFIFIFMFLCRQEEWSPSWNATQMLRELKWNCVKKKMASHPALQNTIWVNILSQMIPFNVLKYFDYPQFGKRCCKQCVKILKFQEERYNLNKISILRRPGGGTRMLRQGIQTPVRRSLRDISVQSKGKLLLSKWKRER